MPPKTYADIAADMKTEPAVPEGFQLSPLMRGSHFVRNLDESLKLYRDLLGLRVRTRIRLEGERSDAVLGLKDAPVEVALLQSGDLVFANVGLFQLVEDPPKPWPEPRTHVETGDAALVFLTRDIFAVNAAVKAAGYPIVSEPMVLFPDAQAETQSYEMLFFDRDGIIVNLIQRNVANAAAP
jgi:catechol 2,3-dioxygenase-like lactoylglutathione lyase family enzyme